MKISESLHAERSEDARIVASVGGDGAFLQAVRKNDFRSDCTYFGIGIEERNYMYVDFNYHNLVEIKQVFKMNNFSQELSCH